MPASVKERLKDISRENKKEFNKVLRQYTQERFLYRLSKSVYADNLILKGALLFLAYNISRTRPTRDIDFLGESISNKAEEVRDIMKNILSVRYDDGLEFDSKNIETENIADDNEYGGIRVKVNVRLGTARERIQIDVGFGDRMTDLPAEIEFPTLLDFPPPKLKVYSLETAIAEKFEAIVSLQLLTSRVKDFYDIYFIAENNSFEFNNLNEAVHLTFDTRSTNVDDSKYIFNDKFKNDNIKNELWNTFIKRNELKVSKSFSEVVDYLSKFLKPVCADNSNNKSWNHTDNSWN